jgi:hypothetical protein
VTLPPLYTIDEVAPRFHTTARALLLHRDLLALKADGGWSSVELVERYAHVMPAGHEAAIRRFWGIGKAAARVA